jgi:hypothetical protein
MIWVIRPLIEGVAQFQGVYAAIERGGLAHGAVTPAGHGWLIRG